MLPAGLAERMCPGKRRNGKVVDGGREASRSWDSLRLLRMGRG